MAALNFKDARVKNKDVAKIVVLRTYWPRDVIFVDSYLFQEIAFHSVSRSEIVKIVES